MIREDVTDQVSCRRIEFVVSAMKVSAGCGKILAFIVLSIFVKQRLQNACLIYFLL